MERETWHGDEDEETETGRRRDMAVVHIVSAHSLTVYLLC